MMDVVMEAVWGPFGAANTPTRPNYSSGILPDMATEKGPKEN